MRFWPVLSCVGRYLLKKSIKLRHRFHKNPDFEIETEQINIKNGGYIEGKNACISERLDRIVARNEKLFDSIYHIV